MRRFPEMSELRLQIAPLRSSGERATGTPAPSPRTGIEATENAFSYSAA
jgi:hypothetical protein